MASSLEKLIPAFLVCLALCSGAPLETSVTCESASVVLTDTTQCDIDPSDDTADVTASAAVDYSFGGPGPAFLVAGISGGISVGTNGFPDSPGGSAESHSALQLLLQTEGPVRPGWLAVDFTATAGLGRAFAISSAVITDLLSGNTISMGCSGAIAQSCFPDPPGPPWSELLPVTLGGNITVMLEGSASGIFPGGLSGLGAFYSGDLTLLAYEDDAGMLGERVALSSIPEPSSLWLVIPAMAGLLFAGRKRTRSKRA